MKLDFSIPFGRLITALFTVGLLGTGIALFGLTYLGSLSIAEHEVSRLAQSQAALSRLGFNRHMERLESQLRVFAANPDLRAALEQRDRDAAETVIEQASLSFSNATLDILIVETPENPGLINAGLNLVDIGTQLPHIVREAMPPDLWVAYTDHEQEPYQVALAISLLIISPGSGDVVGRVVGGTVVTDSFALPGILANIIKAGDIGVFHNEQLIAGIGDLPKEMVDPSLTGDGNDVRYLLDGDSLYVRASLITDWDGHSIFAIIKQPVDTLANLESVYARYYLPFLVYTILLVIGISIFFNRVAGTSLSRLLHYVNGLRHGQEVEVPDRGLISEFNQLAGMFQVAFDSVKTRDSQFRDLVDGSTHGIMVHRDMRIIYVNDALLKMMGYDPGNPKELVNSSIFTLYAPDEHDRLHAYHKLRETDGAPASYEVKCLCKNGDILWCEQQARITEWKYDKVYLVTLTDISARKHHEDLANKYANFDVLTGLPNRQLFFDRLNQTIQRDRRHGTLSAVMVLDIDRFKLVNETYSSNVGDQVIAHTAQRITELLGAEHTVARLGGDDFAIILSDQEDIWEIESTGQKILDVIAQPIELEDITVVLSASLGITLVQTEGEDAESLLLQADTSMYQAKAESGNSYRIYSLHVNDEAARAGKIEIALRCAIETEELHLVYQPVVDYQTGRILKCEALARWNSPQFGIVPPGEFIKVAEESGLIVPLGLWVLKEACLFFRQCTEAGLDLPGISINVSPRQCRDHAFANHLATVLREQDIDPARIHLEITESIMFEDTRTDPVTILDALSGLGVKISLDDFGTGYSSLSYLKRLPIDTLKIDKSFVRGLERDEDGQVLIKAIISLAQSLELNVVCEGVETREQCDLVSELGCHAIQGDSIARPMSGEDLKNYLRQNTADGRTARKAL